MGVLGGWWFEFLWWACVGGEDVAHGVSDPFDAAFYGFVGSGYGVSDGCSEESVVGAHEFDPVFGVDVEALEDGEEVVGDGSAFVVADDAACGFDEFDVVVEAEGVGFGDAVGAVGVATVHGCDPEAVFGAVGDDRLHSGGEGGSFSVNVGESEGFLVGLSCLDACANAGVIAIFRSVSHLCADWIEVDIGHA